MFGDFVTFEMLPHHWKAKADFTFFLYWKSGNFIHNKRRHSPSIQEVYKHDTPLKSCKLDPLKTPAEA